MKRYDLIPCSGDDGECHADMYEDEIGDYVLYADAQAAIDERDKRIAELEAKLRWRKWPGEKPEKRGPYHVWAEGYEGLSGSKASYEHEYGEHFWWNPDFGGKLRYVTHWRPIEGPGE